MYSFVPMPNSNFHDSRKEHLSVGAYLSMYLTCITNLALHDTSQQHRTQASSTGHKPTAQNASQQHRTQASSTGLKPAAQDSSQQHRTQASSTG